MSYTVHCADVLSWCEEYEGEKFHAVLCDPPYGLEFMGKEWDRFQGYTTDTGFKNLTLPRQRKRNIKCPECDKWIYDHDGRACTCGGVKRAQLRAFEEFNYSWFKAIAEHLHPGGFILAFGGSRTYHRLAVAAEDAGLIIHPALVWLNGQGFPKATRIDTQIDKAAGMEQIDLGSSPNNRPAKRKGAMKFDRMLGEGKPPANIRITAPASPLAAAWAGHRYGLQALKPCAEFILCAQKPYEGKPVDCITSTGAGGLWIDGSRVATGDDLSGGTYGGTFSGTRDEDGKLCKAIGSGDKGRWPPNVVLSHLPGCERLGVKRVRGSYLDHDCSQSENKTFGQAIDHHGIGYADPDGTEATDAYACVLACPNGHQWIAEMRGACPECGGEARWVCAVGALNEQAGPSVARPVKPENIGKSGDGQRRGLFGNGSIVQSGYYDDSASVSRFYPQHTWQHEIAERLAGVVPYRYVAKAGRRERDQGLEGPEQTKRIYGNGIISADHPETAPGGGNRKARNPHPTVKPISLAIWLCRLLAPPPEYAPRRLLVPFCGSGSECAAAVLSQNWETVVGIDCEQSYVAIAEARLRFWADWAARGYDDPAAILKAAKQEDAEAAKEMILEEEAQLELEL